MDQAKVRQEAERLPPLGFSTRQVFRSQLGGDGILLHLIKAIDEQIKTQERILRKADLSKDEGVRAAVKIQGKLEMAEQIVSLMFTMAEGQQEETAHD